MNEPADAFGGVVHDGTGRILLREPTNHWGGYVWTWPKGGGDGDETPAQAALREVREETGYICTIERPIPGVFSAGPGTSVNRFFLMRPTVDPPEPPCWETATLRWATVTEARELIGQTPYEAGRERDLAILAAAEQALGEAGEG